MRDKFWNKISNMVFPDEMVYTHNIPVLCSRLTTKPKQIVIVSTPKEVTDEKIFTYNN